MALKKNINQKLNSENTLKEKTRIGWREFISLKDFGVPSIKVKVDTGAATSALHAEDIHVFLKNGQKWVRFLIYPKQKSRRPKIHVEAELISMKRVKSSTGHITERPVVRTLACLDQICWNIDITLVNRDIMGFRMLLGRRALKKNFIVDPSRSFLKSKKR